VIGVVGESNSTELCIIFIETKVDGNFIGKLINGIFDGTRKQPKEVQELFVFWIGVVVSFGHFDEYRLQLLDVFQYCFIWVWDYVLSGYLEMVRWFLNGCKILDIANNASVLDFDIFASKYIVNPFSK
jgi:hypothetical protein